MTGARGHDRSLDTLRRELEEIDRALVLLIAARIDVAVSAISIRSGVDGCLTDPTQEEVVLRRARGWAELAGVSPSTVEAVLRAVVAAGKERHMANRRAEPPVPKIALPTRTARVVKD